MSARARAACRRILSAVLGLGFAACVLAAPVLTVRLQEARLLAGPQPRQNAGSVFWASAVQESPFLYALHRARLLGDVPDPVLRTRYGIAGIPSADMLDAALEKLEALHAAGLLEDTVLEECRAALAGLLPADRPAAEYGEYEVYCSAPGDAVQVLSVRVNVSDASRGEAELQRFLPDAAPEQTYDAFSLLELYWLREEGHLILCHIVPFSRQETPAVAEAPATAEAGERGPEEDLDDGQTAPAALPAWARYLGLDGLDGWQTADPEDFLNAYPTLPCYGPAWLCPQAGVYLTVSQADGEIILYCGSMLAL